MEIISRYTMKYIIEHMEEGFSEWVILEYSQILREVGAENLILSSLPESTTEKDIPQRLLKLGLRWTTKDLKGINEDFKDLELLKMAESVYWTLGLQSIYSRRMLRNSTISYLVAYWVIILQEIVPKN